MSSSAVTSMTPTAVSKKLAGAPDGTVVVPVTEPSTWK